MEIVINGVDFSNVIDAYSIEIYHIKVQGPNSGTSMGGTDIFDTVKVKECFSCKTGIVMEPDYRTLISMAKLDFATVQYKNQDTGENVVRRMTITAGRAKEIPMSGGGYCYKNIALDFREV